jgi:hypothetical protein
MRETIIQNVVVGTSLFLLVLFVFLGYNTGKKTAQSELVVSNASALTKGINFFHADQDRFPSSQEFADKALMLNYFSAYPPFSFSDKQCPQSFSYQNTSTAGASLLFCIPRSLGARTKGVNTIVFQ